MELFIRASAGVLLAVILSLTLGKQGKDLAILLTIAVCCMVVMIALNYIEPVIDLLQKLETFAGLQGGMLEILLKIVGIGLVAEIAGMICSDAGNGSLAKSIQILASAVILWMSIPVFDALIDLICQIMGEV